MLSTSRTSITVPVRRRSSVQLAALVFERCEQRHSLSEIVIGLRVEPDLVTQLFEQYCRGLIKRQLRKRRPNVPVVGDIPQVHRNELERRLAALPSEEVTRISIERWRGAYPAGEDRAEYTWLVELGAFHVAGPCGVEQIDRRYGRGSYRVTACGCPHDMQWEVLIEDPA